MRKGPFLSFFILHPSSFILCVLALTGRPAEAHFLVLLPAADVIDDARQRTVALDILFTHPMEQGPVMEMDRPRQFGMLFGGKKIDLLDRLQTRKMAGKTAYTCSAPLQKPGDHLFFIEPAPYWEPAERKMLIHYAKVIVDYLSGAEGWDQPVGLPVEIEPLVRPYGLWTGNSFRGIVRHNGRPVPFARVEIAYDNRGNQVKLPNDAFATQVVKADGQGVFSYTMPRAGWWGFTAIVDGDDRMKSPSGEEVPVELGGVIWVKTVDMK